MRIEIIGTYPPPIGGISTHLCRLAEYLKGKVNFHIYNPGHSGNDDVTPLHKSKLWFLKFLIKKNKNIVHFHKTLFGLEFLYWFIFSYVNTPKIFITLHNEELLKTGYLKKKIDLFLLAHTRYLELFVVSDKLSNYLKTKKIKNIYLPAYVPIINTNKNTSIYVDHNNKNFFIFSLFRATKNNLFDVYGFDLALKLLKEFSKRLKMLLLIGDKDKSDMDYLISVIKEQGVINEVKIIYNANLVEYFKNGIFYLRANRKDGYGISIQESLESGVLAIASNVCNRPKGTILFENNNYLDLSNKVKMVLKMGEQEKKRILKTKENLKYHKRLLNIYKKYLLKFEKQKEYKCNN